MLEEACKSTKTDHLLEVYCVGNSYDLKFTVE